MANFAKNVIENKLFLDQALSFDHMGACRVGIQTGTFPQGNGDVFVRLCVPGAATAKLHVAVSNFVFTDVELKDCGGGIFEGIIPFDPRMTGPANVNVYVNGAEVMVPDLPVIWTDNRPQNNLEIPDEGMDYLLVKDVSHGSLTREMIYSHPTNQWEHCWVYTPACYRKAEQPLPVLYLLHGGGDNELMWEYVGKMSHILDNLWAEGTAEPFVVVMMNGMLRTGGAIGGPVDKAFEDMLIQDCIPFVEENYRVKTDKWSRAIAGLSMGAYMTCDIGFGHPELFGSVGTFTASMNRGNDPFSMYKYKRPYKAVLAAGSEAFAQNYKLYWRSTTPQENHLEYFISDDELLAQAGITELPCHHRMLYPSNTSKWNSWRMGLRDFAKLVFK